MATPGPNPFDALSQDDLQILRLDSELYAERQLNHRRWRGHFRGVLPQGHDAASIANQSIARLLTNPALAASIIAAAPNPLLTPPPPSNNETPAPDNPILALFRYASRLLIRREVDRLYHLQENSILVNAPDLRPVKVADNDFVHPIETVPDPGPSPLEILIQKEEEALFHHRNAAFLSSLGNRRHLKALFKHFCAEITKSALLARVLRLPLRTIERSKVQLRNAFASFFARPPSALRPPTSDLRPPTSWPRMEKSPQCKVKSANFFL